MIVQGLKPRIFKRLDKFRAIWVAELPSVLWSLRTTPCRATAFTPLLTVYFGAPRMFITLWFGFDYGTNPPLGTLII
jgi:hypothetical protein